VDVLDIVVQLHDGYVVVRLGGALDADGASVLDEHVRPLTGRYDPDQIVLDCAALTEVDDAGVEALLRIAHICAPYGRITLREIPAALEAGLARADARDAFDVEARR
jgi:anti-anti-sigma factor